MFYRRKVILALLQEFDGFLPAIDFQKYLFLLTHCQKIKSFTFVPYKYGCFSFQSYSDKRAMVRDGLLSENEGWKLKRFEDYASSLKNEDQSLLKNFKKEYGHLRGDRLIHYVYTRFPYYAIKSEITQKILNREELALVETQISKENKATLFTLGYEGRSLEEYLNLLIGNNVKILCDVRNNPFSMKYGFSKNQLKSALGSLGIEYLHIPELGIVSEKRKNLKDTDDYKKLFDDYEQNTLPREKTVLKVLVANLREKKRVALTCFEASHHFCHRGRLAHYLATSPSWSFPIRHL